MDKGLLYYEMSKKKKTVEDICKAIGISKASFYRKISGKTQFKLLEMWKIVDVLGLESPVAIFFPENVS